MQPASLSGESLCLHIRRLDEILPFGGIGSDFLRQSGARHPHWIKPSGGKPLLQFEIEITLVEFVMQEPRHTNRRTDGCEQAEPHGDHKSRISCRQRSDVPCQCRLVFARYSDRIELAGADMAHAQWDRATE